MAEAVWCLSAVCLALAVLVVVLASAYRREQRARNTERAFRSVRDHTECVDLIAQQISDKHTVRVLREAAAAYDSVQGQHRLKIVVRGYTPREPGSTAPSIPAMWLLDRAERIEKGEQ